MLVEEIKAIKSTPKELKRFGLTLGIAFGFLGALLIWKHYPAGSTLLISTAFFMGGAWVAPAILKPIHKIWMTLALTMGAVMTRVILTALFYLVITPLGVLTRIFGKDFLDRKFRENKKSYWHERNVKSDYERQF